jgi:transposase
MKITTVGIDLAKNVFQVHGIDEHGKAVLKKQLRRDQMAAFFVNLPPCLIGMEACGSAHHWGRKLASMGHTVRLMAPQFVKPYVKTNKNDAADAEAICEAVGRPNMRFVPVKNVEQQAVLALHRVRQGFVRARTAQANQIRGLLGEFGLIVPQGIGYIATRVPELIEDGANELPGAFRLLVQRLLDHLKALDRHVEELEDKIHAWHRSSDLSRKLAMVPGIGPITASALVASIGDAKNFDGWPAGRSLAGPGPTAALIGREVEPARHEQARRHLSANAADPRRALGHLPREPAGRHVQLDQFGRQPTKQECGGGSAGEQERANRVGASGA